MGKVRAAAVVTIDNPDADGLIAQHGAGYTWRFTGREEDPYSTSAPWAPRWNYAAGNTEYLAEMRACAPRGYATMQDMALSEWTVDTGEGDWEEVAYPERKWLWLREVPEGGYGEISSSLPFYPNLCIWLAQYAAAQEKTEAFTGITLIQENGPLQVGYYLPVYTEGGEYKYPQLRIAPKSRPSTAADTVDEWQGRGQGEPGAGFTSSVFIFENTAGTLRVRWPEQGADPWVYQPAGGLVLGPCKVVITAWGHALAFNAQQVRYPLSSYAMPYDLLTTPSWCNPTHAYYWLGWVPALCGISVAGIGESNQNPDKPVVQFMSGGNDRPVCYLVTQQHDTVFSMARRNPEDISVEVMRASGHIDDSWRGASCDLELIVGLGEREWKGNNLVSVDVGWQDETGGWSSGIPWRQFTGYVTRLNQKVSAEYNGQLADLTLHCEDWISARAQGKKFCINFPCEAGRDAALITKYNLMRWGVPEALIQTGTIPVANLPVAERPGEFLFDFAPETEAVTAQDTIAEAVGCIFGVDQNGTVFVKPRRVYPGTPDFVLDYVTATDHDLIREVTTERCHGELRNYVLALCGPASAVASALAMDVGMHRDPDDPDFLGDDWWEIFTNADVPGNWALAMAQRRLAELIKRKQVFTWETPGKDLWPDQYVQMNLPGLGIEEGSIFRISAKDWRLDKNGGRMELWDTYLCIKESGPPSGS